jgi:pimeloyl-ACP methyl ester carboxylesterase
MNRRGVLTTGISMIAGAAVASTNSTSLSADTHSRSKAAGPTGTPRPLAATFIRSHDGTALFCRDWGDGDPIVFASPWALGSDWWEYQMADLALRGMRCIAYDRRGQDRSEQPKEGYEFDTLSDDLAAVIDHFDLKGATLVAHSMGAGEAVRYLSRHGTTRVSRLALIAPITPRVLKSADNPTGIDAASLAKVRAALSKDRPGNIGAAAPAFFGSPANVISAEMMQWWTQMLLRCPLNVMLALHHAFTETDFTADVRAVRCPTLIIHGDQDKSTLLELTGRPTAKLIAGSRLQIYEGAAHGLPISHAERLNNDLRGFANLPT